MKAALASGDIPKDGIVYANVYSEGRQGKVWEQVLFVTFVFCTFGPPPGLSPILYLVTFTMLGLAMLYYRPFFGMMARSWILFAVPTLAIFSMFWSDYPSTSLRTGILMFLTPLILVYISTRLDTRQLVRALTLAALLTGLYVMPFIGDFANGGPYPGKNVLAFRMQFVFLLALGTALNPKEFYWIRLACLPFIPMAVLAILLAQSATALVFVLAGGVALIGVRYGWVGLARIGNLRAMIVVVGLAFVLTIVTAVLNMPQNTIVADFLASFGKDATLTGRTELWDAAEIVSAEKPWLGWGVGSFWQYNVGAAQTLNEYGFKPPGTVFSFHSAFWETRVHLGFVGLFFFCLMIAWTLGRAFLHFFTNASMETSTLLILAGLVVTAAFTESYLYGTFRMSNNALYLAALAPIAAKRRLVATRVPVTISPAR